MWWEGLGGAALETAKQLLQADMSANQPSKQSRWQSYVDDALMKTGQVSKAAIHALDGARWASSPDFKVHSCRSIGSRMPVEWDGSSWDGSSLASQPYFRKIRLARETGWEKLGMRVL